MRVIFRLLLPFFILVILTGCNPPAEAVQKDSGETGTLAGPNSGSISDNGPLVESLINDNFRDENLNVDQYVENFEGESREVFSLRHKIADYMDLKPGMAIADIGAGTGFYSRLFAERVGDTGKVYAVDISQRFLEYIASTAEATGTSQITTVLGEDRSPNLAPGSVDAVFICDTYHHFEYPFDMLGEIHEALRPGGHLFVIDFKRIPGVTPEWMLNHVRAGQEEFQSEIESSGFEFIEEASVGLQENYMLRFQKPE